jgi:hypothetical protein
MNKSDTLTCIAELDRVIGFLQGKWLEPTSEEAGAIERLMDIQEMLQRDYEGWQQNALPIFVITDHPYFREQMEQEKRERP